jgi:anhydro-N-acetylmuramic acid kinase
MPKHSPRAPSGAKPLRLDAPRDDGCRWLVGLRGASKCDRIDAALVCIRDRGLAAQVELAATRTAQVPPGIAALFDAVSGPASGNVSSLLKLRTQLAEVQAPLVLELLRDCPGGGSSRVMAVGVDDPGVWEYSRNEPTGYTGLCDPARLAEATGLNVIDAFPARDVAAGGQGGPLTALTQWLLLHDSLRSRVLLDLGRSTRLTYLPAARIGRAETRVLSFDVCPGGSLLDSLAQRLTGGQHACDPGGRMAVQGKRIAALVEHWTTNPYFDCPPPRWHPHGVPPDQFLSDALHLAVASNWSVRDILCTATHFIAETVARTLQRLPEGVQIDEIVVTGGGQQNGMLLHEIARLVERPLLRLDDLGFPAGSVDAAAAAVLAMFHLDQVPANPTSITKSATPRLLGRLTGGSPQSWQLLLETCAGGSSHLRPLRTAV